MSLVQNHKPHGILHHRTPSQHQVIEQMYTKTNILLSFLLPYLAESMFNYVNYTFRDVIVGSTVNSGKYIPKSVINVIKHTSEKIWHQKQSRACLFLRIFAKLPGFVRRNLLFSPSITLPVNYIPSVIEYPHNAR